MAKVDELLEEVRDLGAVRMEKSVTADWAERMLWKALHGAAEGLLAWRELETKPRSSVKHCNALCSHCEEPYALRSNGTVWYHKAWRRSVPYSGEKAIKLYDKCPGSGLPPKELDNVEKLR